jgi:hypothetical protein
MAGLQGVDSTIPPTDFKTAQDAVDPSTVDPTAVVSMLAGWSLLPPVPTAGASA